MARSDTPFDPPPTEADIQAFADGTLSPERAARVRAYLGEMPGEANRIAFYRRLNGQIQRSFKHALPHSVEADSAETCRRSGWRSTLARTLVGRRGKVAAVAASLIFALGGWLSAARISDPTLNATAVMALVARATSIDPTNALASADPSNDPFATQFAPLGWRLVAAKTLHPGPLTRASEFDYLNAEGQPIVLVTTFAPLAFTTEHWMAQRVGEVRLLTWSANGTRYVLAGHAKTRGLMTAADRLTLR
jgi:anti-sigma factor RsiW